MLFGIRQGMDWTELMIRRTRGKILLPYLLYGGIAAVLAVPQLVCFTCGQALSVTEDGRLEWQVHSIYSAKFTPYLNSRTLDGRVKVFRYYFTDAGTFAEKVDTGEFTVFRR